MEEKAELERIEKSTTDLNLTKVLKRLTQENDRYFAELEPWMLYQAIIAIKKFDQNNTLYERLVHLGSIQDADFQHHLEMRKREMLRYV